MSLAVTSRALTRQEQPAKSALSLDNVSLSYRQGDRTVEALQDISLDISAGKFVAIVGPSGCGKSTLLHLMSGIIAPTRGHVYCGGAPVNGLMVGTGYMFQSDGLLPWKTVSDNIALPLRLQKRAPAEIRDRVDDWLRRTGLTRFASAYPSQLSGGMRKRAALAQALVSHPDVVLMDEPLSALDVQTRSLIGNELMTLWSKVGNTMVLVTHDLEEAIGMADEVVVLSSRPARVKAVYPIDLPRPRDLSEIRVTESYQRLYAAIWRDLREEVLRAHVEQN
ncbi:MAG TPA: ABC transporter ATP-binding protein [Symbiobacteriaceae bacterium]|nr:ABC transporter ATP-binding protein [Symbiobacteriaceae bacterium]